jgi:hypothetical protein
MAAGVSVQVFITYGPSAGLACIIITSVGVLSVFAMLFHVAPKTLKRLRKSTRSRGMSRINSGQSIQASSSS